MQLKDLNDFLKSDRCPDDSLLVSDLDGFLHAIAAGPEFIMPTEWLQHVWGDGEPEFADDNEANEVIGTIIQRYQEICYAIYTGRPDALNPVFLKTWDGQLTAIHWAEGFMDAVQMREADWQPLLNDRDNVVYLGPILVLCRDEEGNPPDKLDEIPELAEMYANAPDLIPDAVISVDRYWRARRVPEQGPSTFPLLHRQKIGRNEPCPCGSGKKYKKCCGG